MMPASCDESSLNQHGRLRRCFLDTGHDGSHQSDAGEKWEAPGVVLERLRAEWGRTHRIAWTGTLWMATAHDRRCHWRTEVEPTPEQLEERLRRRPSPTVIPEPRRAR